MPALKQRAGELGVAAKVRFIGRVLPTEISNWLKQSDIGVLATRRDVFLDYSFSNKLTEYVIMVNPSSPLNCGPFDITSALIHSPISNPTALKAWRAKSSVSHTISNFEKVSRETLGKNTARSVGLS